MGNMKRLKSLSLGICMFVMSLLGGVLLTTDFVSNFGGSHSSVSAIDASSITDWESVYTYTLDDSNNVTITGLKTDYATLTGLMIPENIGGNPVTTLSTSSLRDNTYIKYVYFDYNSHVTHLSQSAITAWTNLATIELPDSLTNMTWSCISYCNKLTSLFIPKNVVDFHTGYIASCKGMQNIYADNESATLTSVQGVLYNKTKTMLCGYPIGRTDTVFTVPEGVTRTSNSCFSGCTYLQKINLPSTLTTIDNFMINGCSGITEIEIPDSVTSIGCCAFANCKNLTYCKLPHSSASNYMALFQNDVALKTVVFEEGLKVFNSNNGATAGMFEGCTSLENVVLPSTLTTIQANSFKGCTKLKNIIIPSSVTTIADGAFDGGLTYYDPANPTATLESGIMGYHTDDVYTFTTSGTNCSITGVVTQIKTNGLGAYLIPATITSSGTTYNVTSVVLGSSSVTCSYIYALSFAKDCNVTSLTSYGALLSNKMSQFTIPASMTQIDFVAFLGNGTLKHVYVATANTSYKVVDNAVYNADMTTIVYVPAEDTRTEFYIPSTVTTIGSHCFFKSKYKTHIYIPDSVTTINGSRAFADSAITEISYPNSITSLGNTSLESCSYLRDILIPNSVTIIPSYYLNNANYITSVSIPSSVTIISDRAFQSTGSGGAGFDLTIPDSVTSVGLNAFNGANIKTLYVKSTLDLSSANVPSTTTIVYTDQTEVQPFNYVFKNTSDTSQGIIIYGVKDEYKSLTTLNVPKTIDGYNVVQFGHNNPYGPLTSTSCKILTFDSDSVCKTIFGNMGGVPEQIYVPASVTDISGWTFQGIYSVKDIYVDNDNLTYKDIDGVVYSKDGTRLVYFPSGRSGEYQVVDGTTTLDIRAFQNCGKVTNIILPDSLTTINDLAFMHCVGLTSIKIPKSVTALNPRAFFGCSGLADCFINSAVTTYDIFQYCTSLQRIVINCDITLKGTNENFKNCTNLKSVLFLGNVTFNSSLTEMFTGCTNLTSVVFASGTTFPSTITIPSTLKIYYTDDLYTTTTNGDGVNISGLTTSGMNVTSGLLIPKTISGKNVYAVAKDALKSSRANSIGMSTDSVCTTLNSAMIQGASCTLFWMSDSVTTCNDSAFNCSYLNTIRFSNNLVGNAGRCFQNANYYQTLTNFIVDDDSLNFKVQNNALLSKDGKIFYRLSCAVSGTYYVPEGVEVIAVYAVSNRLVQRIVLPDGVKTIYGGAFSWTCYALTELYMPNTVTTVNGSIVAASPTSSIHISDSITRMDGWFYNCSRLVSVKVPEGVKIIGSDTFRNCYNLEFIMLPEGLTTIGANAFYSCSKLKTLVIPSTVTSIDASAFTGVTLQNIIVADGNTTFKTIDGVLYSYDGTKLIMYPANKTDTSYTVISTCTYISDNAFKNNSYIQTIVLNENTTYVGSQAFRNCTSLTSVNLPSSLTSIGDYMFYNCSSMTSITLPNTCTTIGQYAFYNNSNLTTINLDNITSIGAYAFYGCSKLNMSTLPDAITEIGDYAFYNNDGITSFTVQNTVTRIGKYAFDNCSNLAEVIFEEGSVCTTIDSNAFSNCNKLTSFIIPTGVTTISDSCFTNSGLKEIILHNGITSIGSSSFSSCNYLSQIKIAGEEYSGINYIPSSVTSMGSNTFRYCYAITNANFTRTNMTSLPGSIFYRCSKLSSVTLSTYMTSIGSYAFYFCTALSTINNSSQVTSFGDCSFPYCTSLTNIDLSSAVTIGYNAFYQCYTLSGEINLPNVVTIGSNSFSDCNKITKVIVGNSCTTLGSEAFYDCDGLLNVQFGNSVTTIGSYCFYSCNYLKSINFPSTLTEISSAAFQYCYNLSQNIVLPSSLTYLGDYAFNNCYLITGVVFNSAPTTFGSYCFQGCQKIIKVVLYEGMTSIPDYTFSGCYQLYDINFPTSLVTISDYAFNNCSNEKFIQVDLSACANLTTIEPYAFRLCTILSSVILPQNAKLKTIDYNAFYGCTKLTSIVIPDTVTYIGTTAFSTCTKMVSVTNNSKDSILRDYLYNGNTSLQSVNISKYVTSIASYTFASDTALKVIYIDGKIGENGRTSVVSQASTSFNNVSDTIKATIKVFVDPSDVAAYKADTYWSKFNVLANTNGVTVTFSNPYGTQYLATTIKPFVEHLSEPTTPTYNDSNYVFEYWATLNNGVYTEFDFENDYVYTDTTLYAVWSLSNFSGMFTYTYNSSNSTATITGYIDDIKNFANVVIPATVTYNSTTYNITAIGDNALQDLTTLLTLSFSGTNCTTIGANAFMGCTNLKTAILCDSITTLGNYCFKNCTSLTSVHLPDSLYAYGSRYGYCFEGCTKLTSVELPDLGTNKYGNYFQGYFGNSSIVEFQTRSSLYTSIDGLIYTADGTQLVMVPCALTSVILPETTLSRINRGAFLYSKITKIDLPANVTYIDTYAFMGCNLTTITIPETVTALGWGALGYMPNITTIYCNASVTGSLSYMFAENPLLTTIYVGGSATGLITEPFTGLTNLKYVYLYSSTMLTNDGNTLITSLGKTASTVSIYVPYVLMDSYKANDIWKQFSIQTYQYAISFNMNGVGISSGNITNQYVGPTEHASKPSDPVATDSEYTFLGWYTKNNTTYTPFNFATQYVTTNTTLYALWNTPFGAQLSYNYYDTYSTSNKNYTNVAFVTGIVGSYEGLPITIPSSVVNGGVTYTVIGIYGAAFRNVTNLPAVTLPSTLKYINSEAFSNCTSLSSINLPSGLLEFGDYAFHETALSSITIPSAVTRIPQDCFSGCTNLTEIEWGENIEFIGMYAFAHDPLTSIVFPSSLRTIGGHAFAWCTSLTIVTFNEGLEMITDYAFYASALTSVDLPSSVYSIHNHAFSQTDITEIAISVNVTEIGAEVFAKCNSLTTANVSSTYVSQGMFNACAKLANVTLSNTTQIYPYAFQSCPMLGDISIPQTCSFVGQYAFENSGVTNVVWNYMGDTVGGIDMYAFADTYNLTSFELSGNISTIYAYCFDSSNLTNLELSTYTLSDDTIGGVQYIYARAFENCTNLLDFDLPETLLRINEYAFNYCTQLTNVDIPSAVTDIKPFAWNGCSNLENINVLSGNTYYVSYNGILFYSPDDQFTLESMVCMPVKNTYVVTNDMYNFTNDPTFSGNYTFYDGCMMNNKTVKQIIMPTNTSLIYEYAFAYNTDLNKITFYDGISIIEDYAFRNDYALNTIIFKGVYTAGSLPVYYGNAFYNLTKSDITVYVPEDFYDMFNSSSWSAFKLRTYADGDTILNVSLELNGGKGVSSIPVISGNKLTVPSVPIKTGATFAGWYVDEELTQTYDFSSLVSEEFTLYANWTDTEFTINYYMNDGSVSAGGAPQTLYTYTDTILSLIDENEDDVPLDTITPYKTGYKFIGWYTDINFNSEICKSIKYSELTAKQASGTSPIVLYAKWERITYDIEFVTGDGVEPSLVYGYNNPVYYGEDLKFMVLYKFGYTQNETRTGDTAVVVSAKNLTTNTTSVLAPTIIDGVKYYILEDVLSAYQILFTNVKLNTYTISFSDGTSQYASGLDNMPDSITITHGQTIGSIPASTPTCNGYTFDTWRLQTYNAETGKTIISKYEFDWDTPIYEDTTLCATWNANTYEIKLYLNGGTHGANDGEYSIMYYTVEQSFMLPYNTDLTIQLSKAGYDFGGWYANSELTGDITEQIEAGTYGNKEYYAKWDIITYTISYQTNDGTMPNDMTGLTSYTVESTVVLPTPSRTGYNFVAWYLSSSLTGNTLATITPNSRTGNIVVYASWEADDYVITYHLGGTKYSEVKITITENGVTDTLTVSYTNNIYTQSYVYSENDTTALLSNISRLGYSFAGWKDTDDKVIAYLPYATSGNVDLYATWTAKTYNISLETTADRPFASGFVNTFTFTFDDFNATGSVALPTSVTTTADGQYFAGWYNNNERVYDISTANYTLTRLTAMWANSTYNLTLDTDETYSVSSIVKIVGKDGDINTSFGGELRFKLYYINLAYNRSTEVVLYSMGSIVKQALTKGEDGYYVIDSVTSDVTIYANNLKLNSYHVEFIYSDGTESHIIQSSVIHGSALARPTDPTRAGYTFDDWYLDTNDTIAFNFSTIITDDITLTGRFVEATYTATLVNNISGNTDTYEVTFSNSSPFVFNESTIVKYIGYQFDYATLNDINGTTIISTTGVTNDCTIVLHYNAIVYNISYAIAHGNNNVNNPATYTIESATISLGAPTATTGYSFVQWIDSATGSVITQIAHGSIGNYALSASFKLNADEYIEVTYYDGEVVVNSTAVHKTYALLDNYDAPDKNGYSFASGQWYTDKELTTVYNFSALVSINFNLYAKYTLDTYTITYSYLASYRASGYEADLSDLTIINANRTYYTILDNFKLTAPSVAGFTFLGWFNGGSEITTISGMHENYNLVAKFEYTTYYVHYTIDGAENNASNIATYNRDQSFTFLNPINIVDSRYEFVYWASSLDLTSVVTSISVGTTTDTYITAVFQLKNRYVVVNIYIDNTLDKTMRAELESTIVPPTYSKNGYTFDGWYLDNLRNTSWIEGSQITSSLDLFGYYDLKQYSISYDYNITYTGTIPTYKTSYYITDVFALPTLSTISGYSFDGWYIGAVASGSSYDFTTATKASIISNRFGDLSIVAKYSLVTYYIDYNLDGGTLDSELTSSFTIKNSNINLSSFVPTKTGYSFDKWMILNNGNYVALTDSTISVSIAKDISIKASYNLIKTTAIIDRYIDNDLYIQNEAVPLDQPFDPLNLNRLGYTFDGWYTDNTYTTHITQTNNDLSIYGRFILLQYNLTYSCTIAEQSLPSDNPATYNYNSNIVLKNPIEVRGYTFDGWYYGYSETDGVYDFSTATKLTVINQNTGNLNLVARYSLIHYTINYQISNGINSTDNPTTYTILDGDITLNDPTMEDGYTFDGWESIEEGRYFETISGSMAKNITLYARYTTTKDTSKRINQIILIVVAGSITALFFGILSYSLISSIKRKEVADAKRIAELLNTLNRTSSNNSSTNTYNNNNTNNNQRRE